MRWNCSPREALAAETVLTVAQPTVFGIHLRRAPPAARSAPDDVRAGEDGGGPAGPGEQLPRAAVATFLGVGGGGDVDLVREAVGAHRPAVAFGADRVGHLGDAVRVGLVVLDVRDPAMPEAGQVVDDQRGAGEVVVGHHVVRGGAPVPADDDGGHMAGDVFQMGA